MELPLEKFEGQESGDSEHEGAGGNAKHGSRGQARDESSISGDAGGVQALGGLRVGDLRLGLRVLAVCSACALE
jgi:hypothetical protein